MWLAVWLTLFNALGSSAGFINPARLDVADNVPVGILEISIASAFFWAVFRGGSLQMLYPRVRPHPLIGWLLGLWIATWIVGFLGSLGGLAPARGLMIQMRDYGVVPICLFIGYRALSDPRSIKWMVYVIAIGAVGNSLFLMLHFQTASALLKSDSDNVNPLRQIDFMMYYAVVGCLLFSFSVLSGFRLLGPWFAFGLAAFCMIGGCAAVSRTLLVDMALGFLMLFAIIPQGKRLWAGLKLAAVVPIGAMALWGGIHVASAITHRDFARVMDRQLQSLIPDSEDSGVHHAKAWDTRLPSAFIELRLFGGSPLFGRGFTSTTEFVMHGGPDTGAFGHNSWTAVLASTGLIGFSAMLTMVVSMIVVGRRMVFEQVDRATVFMGAIAFIVGINTCIHGFCTMMFNARGAMYYALICGLMIRAREIQETSRSLLASHDSALQPDYDVDEEFSPLLVHDGML